MTPPPEPPEKTVWQHRGGPMYALSAFFSQAMPHLKAWNARISAWAAEASWKRIALLGLVVFVATLIIGNILGVDEPEVVMKGSTQPVKIDIKSDDSGVTIQPSVGGKPTKPAHIPFSVTDSANDSKNSGDSGATLDEDRQAIRLEKDGKKIIIDSHGVRVLKDAQPDPEAKGEGDRKQDASDAQAQASAGQDDAAAKAEGARAAAEDAKKKAEQARRADLQAQVRDAIDDAKDQIQESIADEESEATHKTIVHRESEVFWDFFKVLLTVSFAYLIAIKVSTSNKRRAEEMVKSASQVAEHESLRRQVVEARMQTMQAQVEPHFLFNTLSSVDYLIETDPARASTMQKNLIQYLRAALPQMRENATTLGREVDLVRAYLEILKVRMEERLQVSFEVPDGLRSAEFPPMMLQSLVENAIKHGLEPKAEGGALIVTGEVADGDLFVSVSDTGLGFNPEGAATSGGGLGLSNIRERLALLYGGRARFIVTAHEPSGTRVAIVIPYQPTARRS